MIPPLQPRFSGQFIVRMPSHLDQDGRSVLENKLTWTRDLREDIWVAREGAAENIRVSDEDAPVQHGKKQVKFLMLEAADSEDKDIERILREENIPATDFVHVALKDRVLAREDFPALKKLSDVARDEEEFCDLAREFLEQAQTRRLFGEIDDWREEGCKPKEPTYGREKEPQNPAADLSGIGCDLFLLDLYRLLSGKK